MKGCLAKASDVTEGFLMPRGRFVSELLWGLGLRGQNFSVSGGYGGKSRLVEDLESITEEPSIAKHSTSKAKP